MSTKSKHEGERQYRQISEESKDELFDETNQCFHDLAAFWQFIEQADPEEAEQLLDGIGARIEGMKATLLQYKLP